MEYFPNVITPPELLKLGSSAFYDLLRRWAPKTQPLSNADFDIDAEVGFLPATSISRLPLAFEFWERALDDAPRLLSLGDDLSDEAVSRRESGEQWRQRIREVNPKHSFTNRSCTYRSLGSAHFDRHSWK